MKNYIIRLLFKVDASGLKKQLQSISKEAAKVGGAMAKSMNSAFKTVAKEGGNASKQVVKSLDNIEKKTKTTNKRVKEIGSSFTQTAQAVAQAFAGVQVFRGISSSIDQFAKLESSLEKLKSATQIFGKDFSRIRTDLLEIRQDGVLSFETLAYTARQLLSPNIDMASESVGEFVNALKTVAVVEGIYEDIDFAIQSFVRGLQTGTPELLENLSSDLRAFIQTEAGGFAKVQQDQAARQMVFNEILRKGTEQQEEYNRLLGTTASTFKILANDSKRVSESLGEAFAPVLKEIAEAFSGILEDIEIFLEKMTATEKAALVVGVAMGGLALIISGPLVLAVRGLIAAFVKLNVVSGGVLIAIGAAVTGLAYLISKNIAQSRETFGGLAEELDKTKKKVKELKDELARNPNDKDIQEDINDFLEKQLDLEEKILEKTRERVIAVGQVKSAVKSLSREGAMNLAQKVSEEAFIARVEALKIIQGTKLGTGIEQFIGAGRGEKGTAKLIEEGFSKVQASIIEQIVQGTYKPTFKETGKRLPLLSREVYDAQFELAAGATMRNFQEAFAKSEQQYKNAANLVEQAFTGLSKVLRGGGGGGSGGATGRLVPTLDSELSLTLPGQRLELFRSLKEQLQSIYDFRESSSAMKELSKSLEGTTVSAERYLEELEKETKVKGQLAILDIVRKRTDRVYDSINEMGSALAALDGGIVAATSAVSTFSTTIGGFLSEKGATSGIRGFGGGLSLFGDFIGFASGFFSLFETGESGPSFQELLLERIADTQEKQLETLNRQLELSKTLAGITEDYYSNRLDAVNAQKERELASATTSEEIKAINIKANEDTLAILTEQLNSIGFTGEKTIERLTELNNLTKSSREDTAKLQSALEGTGGSITGDVRSIIRGTGIGAGELSQLETQEQSLSRLQGLLKKTFRQRGRGQAIGGPLGIQGLSKEDAEFLQSLGISGTFFEEIVGGGRYGGPRRTVTTFTFTPTPGGYDPILRGLQESIGDKIANLTAQINNLANVSEDEDDTTLKQIDLLEQFIDVQTQGLELQKESNEIAKANLVAVQPRGFGAVDVSRGGLAFGRDFIPTAASLISNVGVPAQIGSLAVAAEANKTMDQKILDSLQSQLNELKVQTNLLAQLTNTDARIVIANAQQAVKATGF